MIRFELAAALMNRWLPLVAYFVLFALLVFWTTPPGERSSAATLVAAHNLPAGHLLQPTDIAALPGAEAYLRWPVQKGKPITADDTDRIPFPNFELRKNFVPVTLPISRSRIAGGELNATSKARLCPAGKPAIDDAEVRFVTCMGSEVFCLGTIDVPVGKVSALVDDLKTSVVVTVKRAGESCE